MLSPEHTELIRASAISDEVRDARGYYTVEKEDDLLKLGFSDWQSQLVPALVVPLFNVHGKNGAHQIRHSVHQQGWKATQVPDTCRREEYPRRAPVDDGEAPGRNRPADRHRGCAEGRRTDHNRSLRYLARRRLELGNEDV